MIDINELRRLAQAATQHVGRACNYQDAHSPREGHVDFENADLFIASERPQEDAAFYAAANPATVIELINRLEAAESDALEQASLNGMGSEREAALMAKLEAAERERDALRAEVESWKGLAAQFSKESDKAKTHLAFAKDEPNHLRTKVEAMERQEPVAWLHETRSDSDVVTDAVKHVCGKAVVGSLADYSIPLYLAPGARGEEE